MHDDEGIRGVGYFKSLLFLGRYHFEEKEYEVAESECRKLLDVGNHQETGEAKALLREIRAATSGGGGGGVQAPIDNIFGSSVPFN